MEGGSRIRAPAGRKHSACWASQQVRNLFFLSLCILISACGGGGSSDEGGSADGGPTDDDPANLTLSGTVQKGLFTNLKVIAVPVDKVSGVLGEPIVAKVTGQNYQVVVPNNQLTKLEASGQFTSETSGTIINLDKPLSAIVLPGTANETTNINVATTLSSEMFSSQWPGSSLTAQQQIAQSNAAVSSAFNFASGTNPSKLDYNLISKTSDINDPNLQLLIISAGLVETVANGNFFSGGFDDVLADMLAAQNVQEQQAVLGTLSGLPATLIYDKVYNNSGYNLPTNPLQVPQILDCSNNGCVWAAVDPFSVSVAGATVYEARGQATIDIRVGRFPNEPVTVRVSTESDSAISGEDFLGITREIVIPTDQNVATVDLALIIDALNEPTERIKVTLESMTAAYPVARGTAYINVRNGARPELQGQDASDIRVLRIDIPTACNPAINMNADDCAPITGGNQVLGIVDGEGTIGLAEIDLATACTDGEPCLDQDKDWLAELYLVARSGAVDTLEREIALGPYEYLQDSVQLLGEDPKYRNFLLRLSDATVLDLARQSFSNGWQLSIEARVGAAPQQQLLASNLPGLYPVPSSVQVGDTTLQIGVVNNIQPGASVGCLQSQFALDAQYFQTLPPEFYALAGDEAGTQLASGVLCVDYDAAVTSSPAVMVEGSLDAYGGTAEPGTASLLLPPGLHARIDFEIIDPNSGATIDFNFPSGAYLPVLLLSNSSPNLVVRNELHSEGWPFLFAIDAVRLTPAGIELGYGDMRYVMDAGYSSQDPRAAGTLYSNDIYYRGVAGQSGALILGPDGVDAQLVSAGGTVTAAYTAFPKAYAKWSTFSQDIVDNRLQATTLAFDAFTLLQSTACRGAGCPAGGVEGYTVTTAGSPLDGDGFVVGDALNTKSDQVPGWGGQGISKAWSRPDDLVDQSAVKLAVPGYSMPADGPAAHYLLAHLDEPSLSAPGVVVRYPVSSAAYVDGNFHPVGISLGPETYRDDVSGQPVKGDGQDLSTFGARLRVYNGSDPAFDLQSSAGVKYVIRNAGITGVFNVSSASLGASAPQFYGYPLDLERFAVRATDNVLDTYTWIDGRLALNGDAGGTDGLDIWFTNLEIDCSATLGNIDLLYEACDGIDNNENLVIDENCSPELYAWRSETNLFAAGFTGGRAQSCAVASQEFFLQHDMRFAALNKNVAFETRWDPAGMLIDAIGAPQSSYRFDKGRDGDGFPVKTTTATLKSDSVDNDNYGWLELADTRVGVQFWNAIAADARLANSKQGNDTIAAPSVILPAGQLTSQYVRDRSAQRNKTLVAQIISDGADMANLNLQADYEWGATGFGFNLPVYYLPWQLDSGSSDADAEGRQSRFLGRPKTWDLFVLDAYAGINFIEPTRTKLSFGASADFDRLGSLTLQIDISDPGSAAAVDDLLMSVKIINGPLLEPALTDFLDTVNVVNRYANRGLDELMKKGLEESLKKIGEAAAPITPAGQDPFVTISETLTQIRSMPQQVITLASTELRTPLERQLFGMEAQLRNQLQQVESTILGIPDVPTQGQLDALYAQMDALQAMLDALATEVRAIDDEVESVLIQALQVQTDAIALLAKLKQATSDVELVLQQATNVSDSVCSGNFEINPEGNGFLNQAAVRFGNIRKLGDVIRGSTRIFDAVETLSSDADSRQRLSTAKRRIREATGELLGFVDAADAAIRQAVCQPGQIEQVLAKANAFIENIRRDTLIVEQAFIEASQPLSTLADLHDDLELGVLNPIIQINEAIRLARVTIDDYVNDAPFAGSNIGDQIVLQIDCALLAATVPGDLACSGNSKPAVPAGTFGINALFAENPNDPDERDLAGLIAQPVKDAVNTLFDGAQRDVADITEQLLPGAYFTPEELRRLLATEILRSQPVQELRLAMDRHFGEINSTMNDIVLQFIDQVNFVIETALASVTGPVNDALRSAVAGVRGIPLKSAGINGFATIAGNELERAHLAASWSMRGSEDDDKTSFKAALDAESWSARHIEPDLKTPTACAVGENESLLDVKISAYGLPIKVMAADIDIEKLYLGFTLQGRDGQTPALLPIGVFGGINTIGEIGFSDAVVFDPAFAAGLGAKQTYIGASAGASFSGLTSDVAFLVGRVCPGNTALTDLDPDVDKFLPSLPASGFTGAYLRGGATIPIIPGGCALNVGVVADFGTWIFVGSPTTIGGLVGGGATGQVACIASLKGKVTVSGSVSTSGDLKLVGDGWGVAGLGFDCDPGTWTSVPRSRQDDWCGTGDAQFGAGFENGSWDISPPEVDAIF